VADFLTDLSEPAVRCKRDNLVVGVGQADGASLIWSSLNTYVVMALRTFGEEDPKRVVEALARAAIVIQVPVKAV